MRATVVGGPLPRKTELVACTQTSIWLENEAIVRDYEWLEDCKPYREWCVPAKLLNAHGSVERCSEEEEQSVRADWLDNLSS